jgi:hypothetical protein
MIILAFLSTLLLSHPATAQEGGDPTRELQNLVYYPHAGVFDATPAYVMSLNDSSQQQNDAGTETNSTTTHLYELTGTLQYGIVDRLRIGVNDNYFIDSSNKQTNSTTGVVTTSHSHGLSNPHALLVYRYIENQNSNFYADVSLNVGIDVGPAVQAYSTEGRTGNELNGNWNAALALPFYYMMGSNELGLTIQETRSFGTTSYGPKEEVIYTTPNWTTSIILQDRYHFLPRWFVDPQIAFDFNTSDTTQVDGSANTTGHDTGFHVVPAVSVGYLAAEWCLVTLNVSYTNDKNTVTPSTSTSTDTSVNQTQASLQARFRF